MPSSLGASSSPAPTWWQTRWTSIRAYRTPPEGLVHLHFIDAKHTAQARVAAWSSLPQCDVAILEVQVPLPPDVTATPLYALREWELRGRAFRSYGFPPRPGYDSGRWAYGTLEDPLPGSGFIQARSPDLTRGDSDGPVQERQMGRVLGLVHATDPLVEGARLVSAHLVHQVGQDAALDIPLVEVRYAFSPLTDGMERLPGGPLSGVERFLVEYLGEPAEPAPFGGRDDVLRALDRWLDDDAHPYGLIAEPAGRGKSAVLAQWVASVATAGCADVAFIPVSQRFGTALRGRSFGLLWARLRHLCATAADRDPPPVQSADLWLADVDYYLWQSRPGTRPLLVVLDGVDEAADWTAGGDLPLPVGPGNGAKVLISIRLLAEDQSGTSWLDRLHWYDSATTIGLSPLSRTGVAEALASMGDPLATLGPGVVTELRRLSLATHCWSVSTLRP